ncbi:MAG: hypothetical protein ABJZ55_25115 [Fuerstiella sp.]
MSSESRLASCAELFQQQEFEAALTLVDQSLELYPHHGGLWELKGLIHRVNRDFEPSLNALLKARHSVDLQPIALQSLRDCYAVRGQFQQSRQAYLLGFDHPSCSTLQLVSIATGLSYIGEWGLCCFVCDEWTTEAPESADAWTMLACSKIHRDDALEEIQEVVKQACACSVQPQSIKVNVALLLYQVRNSEDAYVFLDDLTRHDIISAADCCYCECLIQSLIEIFQTNADDLRCEWCRQILQDGFAE